MYEALISSSVIRIVKGVGSALTIRLEQRVVGEHTIFRNSVNGRQSSSTTRNQQASNDGSNNNTGNSTTSQTSDECNQREAVLSGLLARFSVVVASDDIARTIDFGQVTLRAVVGLRLARMGRNLGVADQRSAVGIGGNIWREVDRVGTVKGNIGAVSSCEVAGSNTADTLLLADSGLSDGKTTTKSGITSSITTSIGCKTAVKRLVDATGLVGSRVDNALGWVANITRIGTEWGNNTGILSSAAISSTGRGEARIRRNTTKGDGRSTNSGSRVTGEGGTSRDTSLTFWLGFTSSCTTNGDDTRVGRNA